MNLFLFFQSDLEYGMRSGWVNIGAILCSYPAVSTVFNKIHDIGDVFCFSFAQTDDIDVIFGILPCVKNVSFIEQIVEFSTVDFVERDPYRNILETVFEIKNILGSEKVKSFDTFTIA